MQTVGMIYRELDHHTDTIGLRIRIMQTEVTIQSRKDLTHQQTEIWDVEAVDSLPNLGTELTRENEGEVEIHRRIMSANTVYFYLLSIIKSCLAHIKGKLYIQD